MATIHVQHHYGSRQILKDKKLNQFVGYSTVPHNFYLKDFVTISGLSTGTFDNNSAKAIGVTTSKFKLNVGISSAGATGLTTYFDIDGNFDKLNILPNDVLGIGTECVKVLNVEKAYHQQHQFETQALHFLTYLKHLPLLDQRLENQIQQMEMWY